MLAFLYMQRFLLLASAVFMALAWLSPDHYTPWLTFSSELLAFASAMCLLGLYLDRNLIVPKMQWWWGAVIAIPIVQWLFGLEFYFGKALLASLYLFAFGMVTVLGFNLSQQFKREIVLKNFALLLFLSGLSTCTIALLQWFQLEKHFSFLMTLRGNRPYANFAQPNNMATFLMMSLMGAFYLFEKQVLNKWMIALGTFVILFTIALSQSRTPWIACIVLTGYLLFKYRHDEYRLSKKMIVLWAMLYVGCLIIIPFLNQLLLSSGFTHTEMGSVVQRANSSHSRLGIWTQMLYAVREHPWVGYGWNQTSIAQLEGAKFWVHPERTNSAHDIILELLVWNGVVIGSAIVGYVVYWLIRLNQVVRSKETLIAMLMVMSVGLHMLFEFPQDYAYFLLPTAFLLGYIQSYIPNQKTILISTNINTIILVSCILLYGLIWRDYIISVDTLIDARKNTDIGIVHEPKHNILVLDQFIGRAHWYYVNRFDEVNSAQLKQYQQAVVTTPTHYDLFKYAQILANNKQEQQARHQLVLIKGLYQTDHTYESLLSKHDHTGKIIETK